MRRVLRHRDRQYGARASSWDSRFDIRAGKPEAQEQRVGHRGSSRNTVKAMNQDSRVFQLKCTERKVCAGVKPAVALHPAVMRPRSPKSRQWVEARWGDKTSHPRSNTSSVRVEFTDLVSFLGETFDVEKGLFPAPGLERAKAFQWLA